MTGRPSAVRSVRRRWARAAAASLVVAAAILAGCTTVRSNLGTSDSSCYLALPTATRAVHAKGKLVGVQLLTVKSLHADAPRLSEGIPASLAPHQQICVIEFKGSFTEASVSDPETTRSGRLAVVVVKSPSNRLLATVVLDRPPLRFDHFHLG